MTEGSANDRRRRESASFPFRWLPFAAAGFLPFFFLSTAISLMGKVPLLSPRIRQPIEFNHRIHVVDQDLDCTTCHEFVEEETFSGLPDAETCGFCHSEPLGESPEELRLIQILEEGTPLEWAPLFQQPPHVFYSHRRHVTAARLECRECHGGIGESEAPPGRVKQLRMADCQDCHREKGVRSECTSCHR